MRLLSRFAAFVAWVLTPERLDPTDAQAGAEKAEAGPIAYRKRGFVRSLFAAETLPLDPAEEGGAHQGRGSFHALRWLFGPEPLPMDEPAADAGAPARRRSLLRWLFAPEELPLDEPPPAAPNRGGVVSLRWLFAREHLGNEPPPDDVDPPRDRPLT